MEYTKYMIAVPCMDTMPTRFVASLLNMRRIGASKVSFLSGSLVYDARNMLAKEALETEADRILWLDSDMQFGVDLMQRLADDMDAGADFVSGLYFKRKIPTSPCVYKAAEATQDGHGRAEAYLDYPHDSLFQVAGCGFGAVMCTAKMIADVTAAFGAPFGPMHGLGEDLAFCWRARQIGYTLHCDSRVKLYHIGQMAYGEEDYLRYPEGTRNGAARLQGTPEDQ